MQIKVFTLPAQCSEQMEEEVNLFLRQHKVMTVDRQFNPSGGGYCIYKNGNKQNLLPFLYRFQNHILLRLKKTIIVFVYNSPDTRLPSSFTNYQVHVGEALDVFQHLSFCQSHAFTHFCCGNIRFLRNKTINLPLCF